MKWYKTVVKLMGIYDHFDLSKTLNYYMFIVNAFNGPLHYIKYHHHVKFQLLRSFFLSDKVVSQYPTSIWLF